MIIKQKDLDEALAYCEKQIAVLGYERIPVQKIRFTTTKSSLAKYNLVYKFKSGQILTKSEICIYKKLSGETTDFTIGDLRQLVMHEVIHTIKDEKTNFCGKTVETGLAHGKHWNQVAREVMKKYPEYDLFFDKNTDDIFHGNLPVQYVCTCDECGNIRNIRYDVNNRSNSEYCPLCGKKWKWIPVAH